MISKRIKPNGTQLIDKIQSEGTTDYVLDGVVYHNAPINVVLVSSKSEAESLLADTEPGTIAYTAGFNEMWQKAPDGSWADFFTGG